MNYFKQIKDGVIISVESKSSKNASPSFVKATKSEYDNFIASLPTAEFTPVRDLATEIDELKARMDKLEKK